MQFFASASSSDELSSVPLAVLAVAADLLTPATSKL
jgi:hypothetical protein